MTSNAATGRDALAAHILGWDCVEFWVGNARTTAGFLMSAFGFRCTAYAGPETAYVPRRATCSNKATSDSW